MSMYTDILYEVGGGSKDLQELMRVRKLIYKILKKSIEPEDKLTGLMALIVVIGEVRDVLSEMEPKATHSIDKVLSGIAEGRYSEPKEPTIQ